MPCRLAPPAPFRYDCVVTAFPTALGRRAEPARRHRRATFRIARRGMEPEGRPLTKGGQAVSRFATSVAPPFSSARKGRHVVSQGSPRDHQRSGGGQHRCLRVRQPGQARHGHPDRQLRAASRPRTAARTSASSATTCCTRSTSTTTVTRRPDITYQFRFRTVNTIPDTFLYNVGPIESLDEHELEPPAVRHGHAGRGRPHDHPRHRPAPARRSTSARSPPRTTPTLAEAAIHDLKGGGTVFAGQRAEGFYVDLGSIFDLGILRPFAERAPVQDAGVRRHQRHQGPEHLHHRDPGARRPT